MFSGAGTGIAGRCARSVFPLGQRYPENDELCIENDGFCIENDGFCIENDELCIENDGFYIENDGFCEVFGQQLRRVPR